MTREERGQSSSLESCYFHLKLSKAMRVELQDKYNSEKGKAQCKSAVAFIPPEKVSLSV